LRGVRPMLGARAFRSSTATVVTVVVVLAGCAAPPPAEPPSAPAPAIEAPSAAPAPPPTPAPARAEPAPSKATRGKISMYGDAFAGKKTASGDTFDPQALTMAHRTLPFGTRVRVTNLENHQSVEVVVNDRGPAVAGRIADLSTAAARKIGMVADGVVEALLEIVSPPTR
jgi:rare lipoprotein A